MRWLNISCQIYILEEAKEETLELIEENVKIYKMEIEILQSIKENDVDTSFCTS